MIQQVEIKLPPYKRGFHHITSDIIRHISDMPKTGILQLFIKHTSAAITINENADPTVCQDLNTIFNHLVAERQPYYQHNYEGDDDMPAHAKATLIGTNLTIPITNHRLNLGMWQGIFLCEFRNQAASRSIVITIIGE